MNDPRDAEGHDEALSALYRETRRVEPPAGLDQRILTAARMAVESRPTPARMSPKRRGIRSWAAPLALAATVVMAVGVVRLARETGERELPAATAVQSLAQPATERDAAKMTADRVSPQAVPPATLPAAPPPSAPAAGAIRAAPQSAPAIKADPGRSRALSVERKEQEPLRVAPASAETGTAVPGQAGHRSPAEWLVAIAELRRQGRTAEAEASLAEFRRRYPDYPLDAPPR